MPELAVFGAALCAVASLMCIGGVVAAIVAMERGDGLALSGPAVDTPPRRPLRRLRRASALRRIRQWLVAAFMTAIAAVLLYSLVLIGGADWHDEAAQAQPGFPWGLPAPAPSREA